MERKRERDHLSPIGYFSNDLKDWGGDEPALSQEPCTSSRFPTWVTGTHVLGSFFCFLPKHISNGLDHKLGSWDLNQCSHI